MFFPQPGLPLEFLLLIDKESVGVGRGTGSPVASRGGTGSPAILGNRFPRDRPHGSPTSVMTKIALAVRIANWKCNLEMQFEMQF